MAGNTSSLRLMALDAEDVEISKSANNNGRVANLEAKASELVSCGKKSFTYSLSSGSVVVGAPNLTGPQLELPTKIAITSYTEDSRKQSHVQISTISCFTEDGKKIVQIGDRIYTISTASPAVEFVLFEKLPSELRHMIWKLCLPGPTIVEIYYDIIRARPISQLPAPIVLHICQESRKVALKIFKPLYNNGAVESPIYIDVKVDTLYLSDERDGTFYRSFTGNDDLFSRYLSTMFMGLQIGIRQSLKHLAVNFDTFDNMMTAHQAVHCLEALCTFSNLKTLSIVLEDIEVPRVANPGFLDIPWKGCTHTLMAKPARIRKRSKTVNVNTAVFRWVEDRGVCLSCSQFAVISQKLDGLSRSDTYLGNLQSIAATAVRTAFEAANPATLGPKTLIKFLVSETYSWDRAEGNLHDAFMFPTVSTLVA